MAVDIRSPLYILGMLLGIFSFGMLLPAFAEWAEGGQDGDMFLACFAVTAFAGGVWCRLSPARQGFHRHAPGLRADGAGVDRHHLLRRPAA